MTIKGKLMRIQAWTPNFKPEEETPIVPIWVLFPGLQWHCSKKEFITPLLEFVGKVLYLDTASIKRTRASMAKVKVQVDLTKDRPRHVWIGLDDEDLTIGRWQAIEYENIPPYCTYCKHQGHMIGDCNFKIRDEDFKRRKELGAEMKNINTREPGQQSSEHRQSKTNDQEDQQHQSTKERSLQHQPEDQEEEEWQVSKRNTINHKRKEHRGQCGDQLHHKTNCQRGNHKPQHNQQVPAILLTIILLIISTCRKNTMKTSRSITVRKGQQHQELKTGLQQTITKKHRSNKQETKSITKAQVLTQCSQAP